ncbi:MAG: VWA domain-containing protein [Chloroflexi bacterium]|nr:VWA domain-containing protein [Chloroflexota bacterium]
MKHPFRFVLFFALLLAFAWGAMPVRADGIVVPCPPPMDGQAPRPCPTPTLQPCPAGARCVPVSPSLAIKYHRVTVTIDNQVATTRVDQVFLNDSGVDLEGLYIFPLPPDATVSDFAMWVDGKRLEAEVLDANRARQIYTGIVNQRRDPALLEYVGRGAFQARVYPIPAHGEKRIELEYKQVLAAENGLIKYVYPLNTEKFSSRPLLDASVTVNIKSKDAIKAIYSPSHDVAVKRNGEYAAVAGWEAKNVRPDQDFALYFSTSQGDIAVNLLTYKPASGEDGFFVLLAAPKVEARPGEVVSKDVIYVLDVSGSMQGNKIDQAKQAMQYVIGQLNPADRFNIITFSTGVTRYATSLRPASDIKSALAFVSAVRAEGSTDINQALLEALTMVDGERPAIIIFMTDGMPTTGVTDPNRILSSALQTAKRNVRLFTFGVGYDVNTVLLDSLSQGLRGASAYIKPQENINEVVSGFYAKVSTPVLADIKIDWGGMTVNDQYPQALVDLFAGQQIVLAGRYRGGGNGTITLSGTINGRPQSYVYRDVQFAQSGGDASLARLWATRKIGYLLDQVRLRGAQKEIVDEIVSLSVRYGIVTPYTSFLVNETSQVLNQPGRDQAAADMQKANATPAAASGAGAVEQSQNNSRMGSANAPAAAPTTAAAVPLPGMAGTATPSAQREAYLALQYVGDRAFVNNKGVWTDTTFDNRKMTTTKVAFQSADYYGLLDKHPEWSRYFALGANVIVVLDGQAYEIFDTGGPAAQVTPATLPLVTPNALASTPAPQAVTNTPVPAVTTSAPAATGGAPGAFGVPCALGLLVAVGMAAALWLYRR